MIIHKSMALAITIFVGTAFLVCLPVRWMGWSAGSQNGFFLGVVLSCFNAILTSSALGWASRRSNRAFFGIYFGGILWKLIVLGGTFFFLLKHPSISPAPALITLGLMTLVFNLVEAGLMKRMIAGEHGGF